MATKTRDLFKKPDIPTAVNVGSLNLERLGLTPGIQSNAEALSAGLSNISTAFTKFGNDARARQLNNDIIRVKAAHALEKEMPGALLPEAQRAYLELTAKRDTRKFFDRLENEQAERAKLLLESDLTPTQQITQHEDFIRNSYALYAHSAGFTTSQLIVSEEIVEKEASRLQNEFIVAQSKKMASTRNTEINQGIASIYTQTMKNNDNSDDPLELDSLFTDVLHEHVRNEIRGNFPTASDTDLDLRIIQVLGQIAADPDNPQPEILEYLDNPRTRKGRPKFTLIDKVGIAANAAITKAISVFNRVENERKEQEKEEEKELHRVANQGAGRKLIEALQAGAPIRTKAVYAQGLRDDSNLQHLTEPDIRYYSEQYQQGLIDRLLPVNHNKVRRLTNEIKNSEYGTLKELQEVVSKMHLNDQTVLSAVWGEWERGELDEAEKDSRNFGAAVKAQFKIDMMALARMEAQKQIRELDPKFRTDPEEPRYQAVVKEYINRILLGNPKFKDLELQAADKEEEFNHKAKSIIRSIGKEADDPSRTRLALQALRDEILVGKAKSIKDLFQFQEAPKERIDEVKEEKPITPNAKGAGNKKSSTDIAAASNLPLPNKQTPYHVTNIGSEASEKIAKAMELVESIESPPTLVTALVTAVSPETVRRVGERIDETLNIANKIQARIVNVPGDVFAKVVERRGGINPALQINLGEFVKVISKIPDIPARIVAEVRPRLEVILGGEREFYNSRNVAKYLIGGEELLRKSIIVEPAKKIISKMERVFDKLTEGVSKIPRKLAEIPGKLQRKLTDKDIGVEPTKLPKETVDKVETEIIEAIEDTSLSEQEQRNLAIKLEKHLEKLDRPLTPPEEPPPTVRPNIAYIQEQIAASRDFGEKAITSELDEEYLRKTEPGELFGKTPAPTEEPPPIVRPNIAYVQEQIAKALETQTRLKDFGALDVNENVNLKKVNPKLPPISKYLFSDDTLIAELEALGATKFLEQHITSTGREDREKKKLVWHLSAHTADENSVNAFDLRLHNITDRNRKGVATSFLESLKRNGFTTVTAKSGKDFVTTPTQIWFKITKGLDVFMVEVDTGTDHIHIQSGADFDGTLDKQIIKKFN